jgi:hypothetical protein
MKKILLKIIGSSLVIILLAVPMMSVKAQKGENKASPMERPTKSLLLKDNNTEDGLSNLGQRVDNKLERASSTENRLENRQNIINKIREKIASSTTASTSKRVEKLNSRIQNQEEQMLKVKDRLQNKELKITDSLIKIADKIQTRISVLEDRGLDMTSAKAQLALANAKITNITNESSNLATLIGTTITEANQTQLFTDIKAYQDKIKALVFEVHGLLVKTVKEITIVLPRNDKATTTATSTENN